MKRLILILLTCAAASVYAQDSEKAKAVRAYYAGFENHDWNTVASQLADGFTFTTPINDHINLEEYKANCWGTNKFFKKVNLIRMLESGNDLTLLVEINTTDNKTVRNVDVFTFSAGKIKSAEVFFGRGESYPGNKNSPSASTKP
jgi:hypothetical protein